MDAAFAVVDRMTHEQLLDLFSLYGFASYPWDDRASLQQTIKSRLRDGTIPVDEIMLISVCPCPGASFPFGEVS